MFQNPELFPTQDSLYPKQSTLDGQNVLKAKIFWTKRSRIAISTHFINYLEVEFLTIRQEAIPAALTYESKAGQHPKSPWTCVDLCETSSLL
jgi:hypothetical protein